MVVNRFIGIYLVTLHPIKTKDNLMQNYEEIMKEVDEYVSTIDLNGERIIEDCKQVIVFLKEKLVGLKEFVLSVPFSNEAEEIGFFKYKKPALLARLMYFYKVLHIESNRPPCAELWDDFYRKQQEEQKFFFERHVGFYQYYRSGATYRDAYYFLREKREISPETELCILDWEPEFSTGYDRLVARIMAMEMLYAYLTARRRALLQKADEIQISSLVTEHYWTDKKTAAVELIYAIHAAGSIDNGQIEIIELANLFEIVFHVELGDVYRLFINMRERKNSRTVYLDYLKEKIQKRMDEADDKML